MQYENQVEYEPLNFTEEAKWPTDTLRTYMLGIIMDHEVCAFPRKAQELGRVISNAHFELECRAGVYQKQSETAPVEISA